MSILLPTTTVTVHDLEPQVDSHGYSYTSGDVPGEMAGPFPANIQIASGTELDFDGTDVEYSHVGYVDLASWPITDTSRLLDAAGVLFDVVFAARVYDPAPSSGASIDCVQVGLQRVQRERVR